MWANGLRKLAILTNDYVALVRTTTINNDNNDNKSTDIRTRSMLPLGTTDATMKEQRFSSTLENRQLLPSNNTTQYNIN